ncbi:MAG: hypothetical protein R6X07_13865, partial [Desulfatiglandales bacterium]
FSTPLDAEGQSFRFALSFAVQMKPQVMAGKGQDKPEALPFSIQGRRKSPQVRRTPEIHSMGVHPRNHPERKRISQLMPPLLVPRLETSDPKIANLSKEVSYLFDPLPGETKTQNPKHEIPFKSEIRISKLETISNDQNSNDQNGARLHFCLEIWGF